MCFRGKDTHVRNTYPTEYVPKKIFFNPLNPGVGQGGGWGHPQGAVHMAAAVRGSWLAPGGPILGLAT